MSQNTDPQPIDLGGVSINSSGQGANITAINQGTQSQHYHNGAQEVTISEILKPIHDELDDKTWSDDIDTPQPIRDDFESPPKLMANVQEMLEQDADTVDVEADTVTFTERFTACVPFITKVTLEAAKAGFNALVTKHPLVAAAKAALSAATE